MKFQIQKHDDVVSVLRGGGIETCLDPTPGYIWTSEGPDPAVLYAFIDEEGMIEVPLGGHGIQCATVAEAEIALAQYVQEEMGEIWDDKSPAAQAKDALLEVYEMFMAQPELQEIDARFPRGSVFGIVKSALGRFN